MASSEQRGFSLVEITVAVAIIAVVAASSVAFALATRPTALWAATTQFDSMISAARSIGAAYGDGATIFISASPGPSNFRADLYAHRPSATSSASPIPSQVQPITAQVAISESQLLGPPPFAVIIHGNGDIGVRKNYSRGDAVTDAELPCPASNQLVFVFTVNGQTATRTLSCHTPLAYTGSATQKPPPGGGATPTPWEMPSCDPSDNGCLPPPGQGATPPPCPSGTTLYNGVCRAPLILTVTGPTATGGECAWATNTNPCSFSLTEQYYPPPNTFTVVSSPSSPCTANYSITNGSGPGSLAVPNSYVGVSPSGWSITPQALNGSSCILLVYDDRGPSDPNGSARLQIATAEQIVNYNQVTECDPNNPPAPAGTILSTVGDTEYVSNGTTCTSPAPSPSPPSSTAAQGMAVLLGMNCFDGMCPGETNAIRTAANYFESWVTSSTYDPFIRGTINYQPVVIIGVYYLLPDGSTVGVDTGNAGPLSPIPASLLAGDLGNCSVTSTANIAHWANAGITPATNGPIAFAPDGTNMPDGWPADVFSTITQGSGDPITSLEKVYVEDDAPYAASAEVAAVYTSC